MTNPEFDRWWADVTIRWPSVSDWLAKHFTDESQQRTVLRTWRDVLKDVSVADCLAINQQMQSGDAPWVGDYDGDKERLPQHVRQLARRVAFERSGSHESGEVLAGKPSHFPAGKILRKWMEIQEPGIPREEARRAALEAFPVGRPDWEPSYRCRVCQDAGVVTVASPSAIRAVLIGKFAECHHREAVVRCSCKGHLPANPRFQIVVYDENRDYRIHDFLWREDETAQFVAWVEHQRDEYWNRKRHPAFDKFNERAFAP